MQTLRPRSKSTKVDVPQMFLAGDDAAGVSEQMSEDLCGLSLETYEDAIASEFCCSEVEFEDGEAECAWVGLHRGVIGHGFCLTTLSVFAHLKKRQKTRRPGVGLPAFGQCLEI